MKIAINKKYKYITLEEHYLQEEHYLENENFETWVMQDKFETHSIIDVNDVEIDIEYLKFNHFDFNESTDSFVFNKNKYNNYIEELSIIKNTPTTEQILLEYVADLDYRLSLKEMGL